MTGMNELIRRTAAVAILLFFAAALAYAQGEENYVQGEILLKFKPNVAQNVIQTSLSNAGISMSRYYPQIGVYRCNITGTASVHAAVQACQQDPNVAYAEPNYIYRISSLPAPYRRVKPNDPKFRDLWGLNNGNDADIDAVEAWDITKGSKDVIVAIIDTGVDYKHEDLSANIWTNPGESGNGKETNGVDDDGNGYVDDFRGWDFIFNDNDPMDDNGHGTHVSGTIGAVGDNNTGVVGVNWEVSLMPLKFLDRNGSGTTADAIPAILYAADMGARVLSNSWGGGGRSQALEEAIVYAKNKNALFMAAAGNESADNDNRPNYPSNYEVDNVIAVAASDRSDRLASFSNVGRKTVDLAAPGVSILSCEPRNRYQRLDGTSMATPHVSGVAGLILARFPGLSYREVLVRLLGSTDLRSAFNKTTLTGGRLNAQRALAETPVILATRLANTEDTNGPYPIRAQVSANGAVTAVTLNYAVDGGGQQTAAMQNTGQNTFEGGIPGQEKNAKIVYYVEATDDAGRSGRTAVYTFEIKSGGCGSLLFSAPGAVSGGMQALVALANVLLLCMLAWMVSRTRIGRHARPDCSGA